MNIESEILKEHSKAMAEKVGRWIGNDKTRFKELMNLFLNGEYRVVQRSAWIVSNVGRKYPELIKPYIRKMLEKTQEKKVHDAVKRNVMRVLEDIEIPKSQQGLAAEIAFNFLADQNEPVAVHVFAMSVLYNLSQSEPDLKNELKLLIEENLYHKKPAFKSRAKRILKKL